jgi:hypothetical protein
MGTEPEPQEELFLLEEMGKLPSNDLLRIALAALAIMFDRSDEGAE